MTQALLMLLRLRGRLWWNALKHGSWRRKLSYAIAALAMLVFAGFLVFTSWGAVRLFSLPEVQAVMEKAGAGDLREQLLDQMPILFSAMAFLVGVFASFGVLLQGLYLSRDMEFLLAAPLPPRAVFLSKLMQAILPNLVIASLISGPALIGLGMARGYRMIYYPLVPLILLTLVVCGAGVSALLVMGVVRLVAPRRAAEVLGLVGGLTAVICSQSGQLAGEFDPTSLPWERLAGAVEKTQTLAQLWNPLVWPGFGLRAVGQGDWLPGTIFTALTLLTSLGLFTITLTAAERLYLNGWARLQVGETSRRKKRRKPSPRRQFRAAQAFSAHLRGILPAPARAVLLKDARLYRRDIRNLSQLVFPIVLAVVWTVSLARAGGEARLSSRIPTLPGLGYLGIALFIGWSFTTRFGMGSFSMEGRRWWILKASPIREAHLVLAKFLMAWLPSVGLGGVYLLIAAALGQIPTGQMVYQLAALASIVAAQSGLMVAFGIWGARFNWENPREAGSSPVGCLGMVLLLVFTALAGLAFMGAPALAEFLHLPRALGWVTGLSLGVGLCLLVAVFPLRLAMHRLPRLGEEAE